MRLRHDCAVWPILAKGQTSGGLESCFAVATWLSLPVTHTHTHTHTHRLRLRATRSTTLPGEVTSDQATNIGNVTSVAISLDGMREIAIWSSFELANWFDALYHASQLSRCGGP